MGYFYGNPSFKEQEGLGVNSLEEKDKDNASCLFSHFLVAGI